ERCGPVSCQGEGRWVLVPLAGIHRDDPDLHGTAGGELVDARLAVANLAHQARIFRRHGPHRRLVPIDADGSDGDGIGRTLGAAGPRGAGEEHEGHGGRAGEREPHRRSIRPPFDACPGKTPTCAMSTSGRLFAWTLRPHGAWE